MMGQDRDIFEISDNSGFDQNDREDFYDLAFNLKTTVYLKGNKVENKYGEGDVVKISLEDINSTDILVLNQMEYKSAELITIKIKNVNELSSKIDLTELSEMTNLKFIFIKCLFKTSSQQIESFISANPNVRIFYFAQNPH